MGGNSSRMKYLMKNTAAFALGNIGSKFIAFFLVPLYTNCLLAAEYGAVDLVITLGTFVVPVLILNINEAVMRFSLDENADRGAIMSTGLLSLLCMAIMAAILLPIIRLYEPLSEFGWYIYFYFVSNGASVVLLYNLRGREQLFQFSVGSLIDTLCIALLNVVFLAFMDLGIAGFLLAYILGHTVTAVYAFCAGGVISIVRDFRFDRKLTKKMVQYSVILIPNSFMWWIMKASDRIILAAMVGLEGAGIYAVANKLPSLISVVSTVFNQAWNYSAIKENENPDREAFSNRVFDSLWGFICLAGSILLLFLRPILSFYVEESYFISWKFAPPLVVGSCILVMSTFLSSQYTVNKDSKGFLFSAAVGAIANITLNFALIPIFAELGAAIATGISYLAVLVYRSYDIRKYMNIAVFSPKHVLTGLALFISAVSTYLGLAGVIVGSASAVCIVLLYRKQAVMFVRTVLKHIH